MLSVQVSRGPWLFEPWADMVVHRVDRYEAEPETWQRVAATWDRAQTRPHTQRPLVDRNPTRLRPSRLQHRRSEPSPSITILLVIY